MKSLIYVGLALLVAACATPYQPTGLAGGFTETQLDTNVFRVTFKGNGVTSAERAEDMALLRSAELTLQNGFTHFAIADGRSRSESVTFDTPAQATTRGTISTYGNTSYLNARTQVTGGDSFTVVKPSTSNTIICFKGKPQISAFVYDAQFIMTSLGSKYGVVAPK
jgi:hypothetical protein